MPSIYELKKENSKAVGSICCPLLIPSSVYTMTLQSFYFRLLIHMGFSMRMYYASILVLYMWTLIKNW